MEVANRWLVRFAEPQYFSGYALSVLGAPDDPTTVITFVVDPGDSVNNDQSAG
ncbi:MAG TPA: hypothetical protein VI756_13040 [Blastocatellia bacterium]